MQYPYYPCSSAKSEASVALLPCPQASLGHCLTPQSLSFVLENVGAGVRVQVAVALPF